MVGLALCVSPIRLILRRVNPMQSQRARMYYTADTPPLLLLDEIREIKLWIHATRNAYSLSRRTGEKG